ncbi:hypothetical protein ACSU1N_05835 [Thermogladius sp. 4427co]|uniref:hypothetical protein n=1 Tax=Thermogladius sp. 4427co TaxID=3450718 RepID=UPI003F7B130A
MNKVLILVIAYLLLGLVFNQPALSLSSGPAEILHCDINTPGDRYLAILGLNIRMFGDYGVLAAYFTEYGVEAYGVIFLKSPDSGIEVYVMDGDQNNWYFFKRGSIGLTNLSIMLNANNKLLEVRLGNASGSFPLQKIVSPKVFTIVVSNITGRNSPPPSINIEYYGVYVSNWSMSYIPQLGIWTLDKAAQVCGNFTYTTNSIITPATSESTTRVVPVEVTGTGRMVMVIAIVLVLVAVLAFFTLVLTGKAGSPGP